MNCNKCGNRIIFEYDCISDNGSHEYDADVYTAKCECGKVEALDSIIKFFEQVKIFYGIELTYELYDKEVGETKKEKKNEF